MKWRAKYMCMATLAFLLFVAVRFLLYTNTSCDVMEANGISLVYNTNSDNRLIDALISLIANKRLQAIIALDNDADDSAFIGMKQFDSVEHIYIERCPRLTHDGLGALLKSCPNVKNMEIKSCPRVDFAKLFEKCSVDNVNKLVVSGRNVDDKAIEALSDSIRVDGNKLQTLGIVDSGITSESIQRISQLGNLEKLFLYSGSDLEHGLHYIKNMGSLAELSIGYKGTVDVAFFIDNVCNPKLRKLYLQGVRVCQSSSVMDCKKISIDCLHCNKCKVTHGGLATILKLMMSQSALFDSCVISNENDEVMSIELDRPVLKMEFYGCQFLPGVVDCMPKLSGLKSQDTRGAIQLRFDSRVRKEDREKLTLMGYILVN
jgi:hypothetical protein